MIGADNTLNRFNVRVYGILEWEDQVLLIHEKIGDFHFTKFPGGGLELGEGLAECLIREFMEEAALPVAVDQHLYTTDFFQQSMFRPTDQLISVYYKVTALADPGLIRLDEFEIENDGKKEQLRFFWVRKEALNPALVTFPIDKKVVELLR
ncbi:MAG: NUDIX domain-containing protein [Bacteroidia bacterium]|jgi:ADP-ribose pyrophosphatase YjhB (NUDIX family)